MSRCGLQSSKLHEVSTSSRSCFIIYVCVLHNNDSVETGEYSYVWNINAVNFNECVKICVNVDSPKHTPINVHVAIGE